MGIYYLDDKGNLKKISGAGFLKLEGSVIDEPSGQWQQLFHIKWPPLFFSLFQNGSYLNGTIIAEQYPNLYWVSEISKVTVFSR